MSFSYNPSLLKQIKYSLIAGIFLVIILIWRKKISDLIESHATRIEWNKYLCINVSYREMRTWWLMKLIFSRQGEMYLCSVSNQTVVRHKTNNLTAITMSIIFDLQNSWNQANNDEWIFIRKHKLVIGSTGKWIFV